MLNFAEQTGSGAVMIVWPILIGDAKLLLLDCTFSHFGLPIPVKQMTGI